MKSLLNFVLALSVVFSSSLVMAQKDIAPADFSGWLDDYDKLVFNQELNQFVFFNEEARGKYDKVMLQSVTVYAVDAKSNRSVATASSDYLTKGARRVLEEKGVLAQEPGPGVLRYHMAITGVEKSKEDLKAHNLIPVSALFRGAKAATGNLNTYIDAMFEAELVDSVTGERVAATVRKGVGTTDKKSGDELDFDDVKPTLDMWLESYSKTLDEFLARRD